MRRDGKPNFGNTVFTRTFDPNFINGWGKRPFNWELGASVQQEIAPRVGLTAGYYRRWYGNFYTLNNTAVDVFTVHAVQHSDSRGSASAGWRRRDAQRPV